MKFYNYLLIFCSIVLIYISIWAGLQIVKITSLDFYYIQSKNETFMQTMFGQAPPTPIVCKFEWEAIKDLDDYEKTYLFQKCMHEKATPKQRRFTESGNSAQLFFSMLFAWLLIIFFPLALLLIIIAILFLKKERN